MISVLQRCSVTFKMHQPNSSSVRAPPHTHARELPKLLAGSGTSGKEGRQDVRLPRAPLTFAPPLQPVLYTLFFNKRRSEHNQTSSPWSDKPTTANAASRREIRQFRTTVCWRIRREWRWPWCRVAVKRTHHYDCLPDLSVRTRQQIVWGRFHSVHLSLSLARQQVFGIWFACCKDLS